MENEMEWFTWDLAGLYKKDGSPATIFTETSEFHPDSLPLLSGTSEREAHRYLQDLGKIITAMVAEKIAPHHKLYIWRRNLWAINIVLRSYFATSSASPVSFGEVPLFPSLDAELYPVRKRSLLFRYFSRCGGWIDDLERLVFQGHPSSPERLPFLFFIRYTGKVWNIYQRTRFELMKTEILRSFSLSTLARSTATSNNSSRSPRSPFETNKQYAELVDVSDIISLYESMQI